ncbi:MAG: hypothetical protein V3T58_07865 [Candidatus Hydrothermarchaeales archaeon]
MVEHTFSSEERIKNIENFLFFGVILIVSFIFISDERFGPIRDMELLGDVLTLFALFPLFFSYLLTFFYFYKISKSSGESTANTVINSIVSFVENNKSWLSYPVTLFLILIFVFVAKSFPGVGWEHIIPPILGATLFYVLKMHPKIHERFNNLRFK